MPVNLAVVGLGRIGVIHALHAKLIAAEFPDCRLVALVDTDVERTQNAASRIGVDIPVFASPAELAASGIANASIVCTPTAMHQDNAGTLIRAGHRVLLEKPMTESVASDREFARMLDAEYPDALMLAFQRRFDGALRYVRTLLEQSAIGRPFKIVSILEDSRPAPAGYRSGGILKDMSVHNVDEILWLTGRYPDYAASGGSIVYARRLGESEDEYDDGFLQLWFGGDLVARIEVSRNHVSGYRIETWVFGEQGQIHVGRFEQDRRNVVVEVYGRDEPIERKVFLQPDYADAGGRVPEFVDRFGLAYREEVRVFVDCCCSGQPFPVTHRDGVRAMEVIEAAEKVRWTRESAQRVGG